MNEKGKQILGIVTIIVVISAIGTLVFSGVTKLEPQDYVSTIRVPGIVEGTAQMIDTQSYFTKNKLVKAYTEINLVCNDSNYMEIAIGYKDPKYDLTDARIPSKELTLWSNGNKYPLESQDKGSTTSNINVEWNLLTMGFSATEYIKADERIWYLKIKDNRMGPFGYEKNITMEYEGNLFTVPDFVPNMNYLDTFELRFNDIVFKTLFHPFFDGSTEVVVPIRGVQHELVNFDGQVTNEILGDYGLNSWSTTTGEYGNTLWCIVFATQVYDMGWDDDLPDIRWAVLAARTFIKGTDGRFSRHPVGLVDYGWNVAYCMDGDNFDSTDMKTVSKTDESYLKSMLDYADGKLGQLGRLIVYVHGHGHRYDIITGPHVTLTTNSRYRVIWWSNVMTRDNYYTYIDKITDGGTHVFLWVDCCNGYGLESWPSGRHNYCLEVWCYQKYSYAQGPSDNPNPPPATFTYDTWDFYHSGWPRSLDKDSEGERFFSGAEEGSCVETITHLGEEIVDWFNNHLHLGDSTMIQTTYWGNHVFYIDWG
ncbi:MAG TPA: hypothetical protein VMX55_11025 [candidate division Zixibacteria bacterium]|nr:hypothetical protein [candidate division Zixibacteria bacterium]